MHQKANDHAIEGKAEKDAEPRSNLRFVGWHEVVGWGGERRTTLPRGGSDVHALT
jgi:hypothetical protein